MELDTIWFCASQSNLFDAAALLEARSQTEAAVALAGEVIEYIDAMVRSHASCFSLCLPVPLYV